MFDGLFDAATHQELRRLPELFCGFNRRPHRGPTAYPVACSPQAWAAASLFGLLAACLGLELSHDENEIRFRDPVMPSFLDEVVIRNLRLGALARRPAPAPLRRRRDGQCAGTTRHGANRHFEVGLLPPTAGSVARLYWCQSLVFIRDLFR